jgi:hypothetical protein
MVAVELGRRTTAVVEAREGVEEGEDEGALARSLTALLLARPRYQERGGRRDEGGGGGHRRRREARHHEALRPVQA